MENVISNLSATTEAVKMVDVISNLSATTEAITGMTYSAVIILLNVLFSLTCLWIILINGLLIVCFWLNRKEAWCSQSKNILSIIIVDMLDGLSTMTWFFVSFKADIDRSVCLTSTALSMATHSAASLNILRVCVTRLRSVRSTSVTHEQSTSKVIIQTILIWLVASALVLVPLGFWTVKQPVLKGCRWTTMFSSNEAYVNTYMLFMIALPTVGTTVFYGLLVRKLRKLTNLVQPTAGPTVKYSARDGIRLKTKVNETLFQATNKAAGNVVKNKTETMPKYLNVKNTLQIIDGNFAKKYSSKVYSGKDKNLSDTMKHDHIALNNAMLTDNDMNDVVPNINDTIGDKRRVILTGSAAMPGTSTDELQKPAIMSRVSKDNLHGEEASTSRSVRNTNPTVTAYRNQRMNKVITVLGISLVLINISNLPFTVFLFWKASNPATEVSGTLASLSAFFLMINSASNVFVYVVQLESLRLAVLKTLRDACRALSKVARCQTRVNPHN